MVGVHGGQALGRDQGCLSSYQCDWLPCMARHCTTRALVCHSCRVCNPSINPGSCLYVDERGPRRLQNARMRRKLSVHGCKGQGRQANLLG